MTFQNQIITKQKASPIGEAFYLFNLFKLV
jgi:hypothetical protein